MQTKSHHVLPVFVAAHSSTSASAVANIPSPSRAFPPGQPQLAVSRSLPSKLGTKLSKRGIVTRVRGILLTEASAKSVLAQFHLLSQSLEQKYPPGRQQNLMPGPFRVSFFQERGHAFTEVLRRADVHILFHRRRQLPIQLFAGVSPQQPLRRLQRCGTVLQQCVSQLADALHQLICRNHLGHQSQAEGFVGAEDSAGQQQIARLFLARPAAAEMLRRGRGRTRFSLRYIRTSPRWLRW